MRSGRRKAKQRTNPAFKASTKNKASLKTKPSAKLKSKKKHSEKTALVKASAKAGSKQHLSEDLHHCLHLSKHHLLKMNLRILFPCRKLLLSQKQQASSALASRAGPLMAAPQVCTPVSLTLVGGAQEL